MNNRVPLIFLAGAVALGLVGCEKYRTGTSTAGTPGNDTNPHTTTTPTNPVPSNTNPPPTETGKPPANTTTPREGPTTGPSDTKLTSDVNQAIQSDSMLSTDAKNCTVSVTNGVATLSGTVDSQKDRDEVVSKARGVTGVSQVIDHLEVKSK